MNNKSIILFTPTLNDGGMENKTALLANMLHKQGWAVEVWVLNNITPTYFLDPAIKLIDLKIKNKYMALLPLTFKVQKLKPEKLISISTPFNALWILVKLLTGYPQKLAVSERNHLSAAAHNSPKLSDRLRPFIVRILYPSANLILCVSESVKIDLANKGNFSEDRLITQYNMIDLEEISRLANEPAPKTLQDIPSDVPVLLAIGRLIPQKDHLSLINAFTKVPRQKNAKLVILGEGPLREDLEEVAQSSGLGNDVIFPGFDPNPYPWYKRAEVVILPSIYEGLPGVLLEALAMRKKIVATDCPGGSSEILLGGKLGKLVPVRDIDAMATAISESLNSSIDGEALYRRAGDFSTHALLPKTISILEKI